MTLLREILDIPEKVHRGDFVLRLTEGVDRAEATLADYVVTPQLERCFDDALSLIRSAVENRTSKGAYLHGSFGSGKSHFMAVLHLLLRGHPTARAIPELASTVARHNGWTEGKRFLVVPYHMIGARSLESAILGHYVAHVRQLHPNAPTPAVYLAEHLFGDAKRLRAQIGDEAFFRALNGDGEGSGADDGWGELSASWDAERFEAALVAPPEAEDRGRLVSDLVARLFSAYAEVAAGGGETFVNLDDGLSVMSRHAQSLGYDAVILFLDELILWLASNAADTKFVNREGQKLAKLVEAQRADRPIPIVSFVARQRDLRELVGAHVTGAEELGFADVLNWWEARFATIKLEDRNLAAIAERRLLRPRSDSARRVLDQAFAETEKARADVLETLLTRTANRQVFRQVYPFSPALVSTLVAVSSLLQRERTALKVMLHLLVEQRDTLAVGDIVPVGDLFDVISEGDEAFSESLKRHFENAKKLYHQKLLPVLEAEHGVSFDEYRVLPFDDPRARNFRADDRLVKTLLLSALVEREEALANLTAGKLAALNHGNFRSPIPGREAQTVLTKVRRFAGAAGEIRISDDSANPTIAVQLTGVDTESILEKAKGEDNPGNRRRAIKALLLEQLGVADADELWIRHDFDWRGTRRSAEIVYANVRELPLESLTAKGDDWRVVIDFPFDEPGYTPKDDLAKIREYRDQRKATNTIVWIPQFLSRGALADLGRFVTVDYVLRGDNFDRYGSHLSALDRQAARPLLDNLRSSLRQRLITYLEGAYAIAPPVPGSLDDSHEIAEHVQSLEPTFSPRPPAAANLRGAFGNLLEQALDHQFPGHPVFTIPVKIAEIRKVYAELQRAAQEREGRIAIDKPLRPLMRGLAQPLNLGEMGETHFVPGDYWEKHFLRLASRDGGAMTVAKLRGWMDDPQRRGLPREVQNLLILAFADRTNRAFIMHSGPGSAKLESIDDEVELREETLPDESVWRTALDRASAIFGLACSEYRTAANVTDLAGKCRDKAEAARTDADRLVRALRTLPAVVALSPESARVRTAGAALGLVESIRAAKGRDVVNAIASAALATSAQAMATSLVRAGAVCAALEATRWDVFETVSGLDGSDGEEGRRVRDRVVDALGADEYATALAPVLRAAENEALAILKARAQRSIQPAVPPTPPVTPAPTPVPPPTAPASPPGGEVYAAQRRGLRASEARALLKEAERALGKTDDVRVDVEIRVWRPGAEK